MKSSSCSLYLFLLYSFSTFAQTDSTKNHIRWHKNKLSLTVAYTEDGVVAPTNIFVNGTNQNSVLINEFQAINIKLGTQTTGESLQEQIFNYPAWGIGFKALNFYNRTEIGIPLALYGYVDVPLLRFKKFTVNAEMGFGVSFNWNSFNPITNKYNVALGLGQAFMSDGGVIMNYALAKHIDFVAGFNFSHYSNGALKLPNFGINSYGPKIGLKYNFYERPDFVKHQIPDFEPKGEWVFSTFMGLKNVIFDSVNIDIAEKYKGLFFPIYGFSALYNVQVNHFSKIGIGATLNYNGAVAAQVAIEDNELDEIDTPFSDKLQLSIYPSYELCIDKISVMLQPAFYIYRKKYAAASTIFHQRISINYKINDHLFAGITLRDFFMHADFVEWTVGYRLNSKIIK